MQLLFQNKLTWWDNSLNISALIQVIPVCFDLKIQTLKVQVEVQTAMVVLRLQTCKISKKFIFMPEMPISIIKMYFKKYKFNVLRFSVQ